MKCKAHLFLLMPLFGWGQNLVPNPSFEVYEECPEVLDLTGTVTEWISFAYTCDYYNACAPQGLLSVPLNVFGNQEAIEGQAYAGILTYDNPNDVNYREYLGVELIEPLQSGIEYYVSYYVSRGGHNCVGYATNNQGVMFSTQAYSMSEPLYPPNYSHINNAEIISDTTFWHQIKGSFVSDENYSYLIIGNFYTIENTDTLYTGGCNGQAYYYVDEVRVSTDSTFAWEILSTVPRDAPQITVYPNPFCDAIRVVGAHQVFEYQLLNSTSEIVVQDKTYNQQTLLIETAELSEGLYYLRLFQNNKQFVYKLFKQTKQ